LMVTVRMRSSRSTLQNSGMGRASSLAYHTSVSDLGLTHVALPVTSLDASVAFYRAYANMDVVQRRPQVVWLGDGTRPFVIVLIETDAVEAPLRPLAHLGVACGSREEVDRLCEKARSEGVLIDGPEDDGPPVGYWAFLRDPDGHTLEVSHGQDVELAVAESD
jgi:catechol 2,3-dioxygenase-like lactoylglutathione lyase family enzyme